MKLNLTGRRTCGNTDCPDPDCMSSCPECGALTASGHPWDCPIGGRREGER